MLLTAAILAHAVLPRFEVKQPTGETTGIWRFDRWTGRLEITNDRTTPWLKITEAHLDER